jgi:hypothetical protein
MEDRHVSEKIGEWSWIRLEVLASANIPADRRYLMLISVSENVSETYTPINRLFAADIEFRGHR